MQTFTATFRHGQSDYIFHVHYARQLSRSFITYHTLAETLRHALYERNLYDPVLKKTSPPEPKNAYLVNAQKYKDTHAYSHSTLMYQMIASNTFIWISSWYRNTKGINIA